MSNVHSIHGGSAILSEQLRAERKSYGLKIAQAAAALSVPASVYESWESNTAKAPSASYVEISFKRYCEVDDDRADKNFLFGNYPLSMARSFLRYDVESIATEYGFKPSTWRKFENHSRKMKAEVIQKIEQDIRDSFMANCMQL